MDQLSFTPDVVVEPVRRGKKIVWTEEDHNEALEMYRADKSMEEIGVKFGKSRSAIAGIIHRARKNGLLNDVQLKRSTPNKYKGIPPRPEPVKVAKMFLKAPVMVVPVKPKRIRLRLIDNDTAVTFAELKECHCRWPFGEPRRSDFRFCGQQRLDNDPYCAEHKRMSLRVYDKQSFAQPRVIRPSYRR